MAYKPTSNKYGGDVQSFARKPSPPDTTTDIQSPGDPDYSIARAPSQSQFPAAAGEKRLEANKAQAEKVATLMQQIGVSVPEEVEHVRQAGEAMPEGNLFSNILTGLGAPFRAVNLGVQDIVGGEAASGFDNPTPRDYWDAFMGKDLDVMLRTGLNPSSGSETIALMGWEEEKELPGKVGRGVVTFLYEALVDPTSYLTFGASGLGRKVLSETGDLAARQVAEEAAEGVISSGLHKRFNEKFLSYQKDFYDDAVRNFDDDLLDTMTTEEAQAAMDGLMEQATKQAKGVTLRDARDEVVGPLVSRNFGDPALREWGEFLPAYAQGGARFSIPFFGKRSLAHGWTLPGTQGLGRRFVGDKVRAVSDKFKAISPAYDKIAKTLSNLATGADMDKALLRAVAQGSITGGDYMLAKHGIANEIAYESVIAVRARLQNEAQNIHKNALDAMPGLFTDLGSKDFSKTVNRGLFQFINTGGDVLKIGDEAIDKSSDLYRQAQAFRDFSRTTMDSLWDTLKRVAPDGDWGDIQENYIPYVLGDGVSSVLRELATAGAFVDEALRGIARGKGGAGAHYLQALLSSVGKGGRGEAALGSSARMLTRQSGFSPVVKLVDESEVMLFPKDELTFNALMRRIGDITENVEPGYIDAVQLNDLLEPVLADLVEKHGVHLGTRSLRVFDEDPFKVVDRYAHDMDSTIRMRGLLQLLEDNGLIVKNKRVANVQEVLANVSAHLNDENIRKRLNDVIEAKRQIVAQVDPDLAQAGEPVLREGYTKQQIGGIVRIAGQARKEMDRKNGKVYSRLYLPPARSKSAGWRKERLMDDVAAARTAGIPTDFYYSSLHNRWYRSVDEVRNDAANLLEHEIYGSIDGNFDRAVNEGYAAVASFDPQTNRMILNYFDNTSYGDVMQRQALDFAESNGIAEVLVRTNAADEGTAINVAEQVKRISDVGAYQHARANIFRTFRHGESAETQAASVFRDVADRKRRQLHAARGRSTRLSAEDDALAFEAIDGYDVKQLRQMGRGVMYPDSKGRWVFEPALPGEVSHTPAWERLADRLGIEDRGQMPFDGVQFEMRGDTPHFSYVKARSGKEGVKLTSPQLVAFKKRFASLKTASHYMDSLVRKLGKESYTVFDTSDEVITREIAGLAADPDRFDDADLYAMVEKEFRDALKMNKKPAAQREMIDKFVELYGDGFVEDQLRWTKDVLKTERAAYNLTNALDKLYALSRTSAGPEGIGPNTVFGIASEGALKDFETHMKRIKAYGRQLGIDPETFEIKYTRVPGKVDSQGKAFVEPGIFNVGGEALANKSVQKDINAWLEQLASNMSSVYTPDGIAQLKTTANSVQKWWKTMVTLPRATFHIRNFLGGVWNNQIIGVGASDYLLVRNGAMKIRSLMRNNVPLHEAIGRLAPAQRDVFRAAWDSGLLDLSFSSAEFRGMTGAARTALEKTLGAVNVTDPENFALARVGAYFMESIEDFLRVSAFATWYDPKRPWTKNVAKEMALGVHFDYKNLTKFETQVKKFIPFFVWQRRNIPLQLQQMVERPGLITRYGHFMNAANEQFGNVEQDEFSTSPYLTAETIGTDIVLNEDTPFWARLMVDPDVPVADLHEIMKGDNPMDYFKNGIDYMFSSLGPMYDFARDMVEQEEYGNVNAPAGLHEVLSQLARTGFLDYTEDGDPQIPYITRTAYYMLAPWQRELEDMGVLPQYDPERRAHLGVTEGEGLMSDDLGGVLGRAGLTLGRGLGIQTQTPRDSASAAWQGQQQLNDIVSKLFKSSPEFRELWEESTG